jgi:hypothetical protein
MILQAPTGLYVQLLPDSPTDSESVTYTCSKPLTPRPELLYPQIPNSLLLNVFRYGSLTESLKASRSLVATAAGAAVGSAALEQPLFAPGDVLEFTDQPGQAVIQEQADLTVRHDLFVIDLATAGIEDDGLTDEIKTIYAEQMGQYVLLQQQYADVQVEIDTLQRQLNETRKVLGTLAAALTVRPDSGTLQNAQINAQAKLVVYQDAQERARARLVVVNDGINSSKDRLRGLAALVH